MCAFQRVSVGSAASLQTAIPESLNQVDTFPAQVKTAIETLLGQTDFYPVHTQAEIQGQIAELSQAIAEAMLQSAITTLHGTTEVQLAVQGHIITIQQLANAQLAVSIDNQNNSTLIFNTTFSEVLEQLHASNKLESTTQASMPAEDLLLQHEAVQEQRMMLYLANPANNVPLPILQQTMLKLGQTAMEEDSHLFFSDTILTYPYKSSQLTEKINNLQKNDRIIIPVSTIKDNEIDLLYIECHANNKTAEITLFNSSQYSVETVISNYEEVMDGLQINGMAPLSLKILQPAFKEQAGFHHDGAIQATLFLQLYLSNKGSTINQAYTKYKHTIKQYEQEANKLKKTAITSEEITAAREHTTGEIRNDWLNKCLQPMIK